MALSTTASGRRSRPRTYGVRFAPVPPGPAMPPSRPLAGRGEGAIPRGVKDALRRPARAPPGFRASLVQPGDPPRRPSLTPLPPNQVFPSFRLNARIQPDTCNEGETHADRPQRRLHPRHRPDHRRA